MAWDFKDFKLEPSATHIYAHDNNVTSLQETFSYLGLQFDSNLPSTSLHVETVITLMWDIYK